MNIIVEGPDACGKSTLARYLSQELNRPIIQSEGPEKFPGEINERIRRYRFFDNIIFDRHPAISQGIYASFNDKTMPDKDLVFDLYETRPVIVYCMARGVVLDHQAKAHDSPEHLEQITVNSENILLMYDRWALDFAHILHRVGNSMPRIVATIRGMLEAR